MESIEPNTLRKKLQRWTAGGQNRKSRAVSLIYRTEMDQKPLSFFNYPNFASLGDLVALVCSAGAQLSFLAIGGGNERRLQETKESKKESRCRSERADEGCNLRRSGGSLRFLIVPTGCEMTLNYSELTSRR